MQHSVSAINFLWFFSSASRHSAFSSFTSFHSSQFIFYVITFTEYYNSAVVCRNCWQVTKVIWRRLHRIPLPLPWGIGTPVYVFLVPQVFSPYANRAPCSSSRVCTAKSCETARQTDSLTDINIDCNSLHLMHPNDNKNPTDGFIITDRLIKRKRRLFLGWQYLFDRVY